MWQRAQHKFVSVCSAQLAHERSADSDIEGPSLTFLGGLKKNEIAQNVPNVLRPISFLKKFFLNLPVRMLVDGVLLINSVDLAACGEESRGVTDGLSHRAAPWQFPDALPCAWRLTDDCDDARAVRGDSTAALRRAALAALGCCAARVAGCDDDARRLGYLRSKAAVDARVTPASRVRIEMILKMAQLFHILDERAARLLCRASRICF